MDNNHTIAVIGAGPAGLMAAEILSRNGLTVTVYERMRSAGRKFLMAGHGGLNLTHSEEFETFCARYGEAAVWMTPYLQAFPPAQIRRWADGLGAETFVGTSGRIFPKAMKATPILRAWLHRLTQNGVAFRLQHDWRGWDDGDATNLYFDTQAGPVRTRADATVLALGGASWPRLGSNGAWTDILAAKGIAIADLRPANCGFLCAWSPRFQTFAGHPLKGISIAFSGRLARGEAVVTVQGIEGGCIYTLAQQLREAIETTGKAEPIIDLRPDLPVEAIVGKLANAKRGQSQSNILRKNLRLSPTAINLLREIHGIHLPEAPFDLARCIKATPLSLTAPAPLARAISTAGGIKRNQLGPDLQLARYPNIFAIGEMLDWEAPTGGYLLTGCLATAAAAANGILRRLQSAGLTPSHPETAGHTG